MCVFWKVISLNPKNKLLINNREKTLTKPIWLFLLFELLIYNGPVKSIYKEFNWQLIEFNPS